MNDFLNITIVINLAAFLFFLLTNRGCWSWFDLVLTFDSVHFFNPDWKHDLNFRNFTICLQCQLYLILTYLCTTTLLKGVNKGEGAGGRGAIVLLPPYFVGIEGVQQWPAALLM